MPRRTDQRSAIRQVFEQADRPLNAQEVLDEAQEEVPGLGIATVYRNLKKLVEQGWLHTVDLPNEPSRYERSNLGHHHHFQCTTCQLVFDVHACTTEVVQLVPDGFEVDSHEILLYGTCPACNLGATES